MIRKTLTQTFSLILLVSGLLLFSSLNGFSQENNDKLVWSKGIKDYGHGIENLGATKEYMLLQINNTKSDIAILRRDNYTLLKQYKAFTPKVDNVALNYQKSVVFDSALYVLANNADMQFVLKYSIPEMKLIKSTEIGVVAPFRLSDTRYKDYYQSIKHNGENIQFMKSTDGKILTVLYNDMGKNNSIEYIYHTIGKKIKDTTTTISIDADFEGFLNLNTIIANDGTLYMFYRIEVKKGKFYYFLYNSIYQATVPMDYKIDVYNQKLLDDKNGVSLVGICNYGGVDGFYKYNFSKYNQKFEEFYFVKTPEDKMRYIQKYQMENSGPSATMKKPELNNYSVDGVFSINENMTAIYGENYNYSTIEISKKKRMKHQSSEMYFAIFDNNNQMIQFNIINKNQIVESPLNEKPSWNSYLFYKSDSSFNFIYSDEDVAESRKTQTSFLTAKTNYTYRYAYKLLPDISDPNELYKSLNLDIIQWPMYTKKKIYPSIYHSLNLGNGEIIIGSENKYDSKRNIYKFAEFGVKDNIE